MHLAFLTGRSRKRIYQLFRYVFDAYPGLLAVRGLDISVQVGEAPQVRYLVPRSTRMSHRRSLCNLSLEMTKRSFPKILSLVQLTGVGAANTNSA